MTAPVAVGTSGTVAVHNGAHVFGAPEQPATPAASYTDMFPKNVDDVRPTVRDHRRRGERTSWRVRALPQRFALLQDAAGTTASVGVEHVEAREDAGVQDAGGDRRRAPHLMVLEVSPPQHFARLRHARAVPLARSIEREQPVDGREVHVVGADVDVSVGDGRRRERIHVERRPQRRAHLRRARAFSLTVRVECVELAADTGVSRQRRCTARRSPRSGGEVHCGPTPRSTAARNPRVSRCSRPHHRRRRRRPCHRYRRRRRTRPRRRVPPRCRPFPQTTRAREETLSRPIVFSLAL